MSKSTSGKDSTAAGTEYTVRDGGTIELGGTTYRIEVQEYHSTGGDMVWLIGPRGAQFFLRGFLGVDLGYREVIRWGGAGRPLVNRKTGRKIEVTHLGDVIEEVAR